MSTDMTRRRDLFRLAEVEIELAKVVERNTRHVLLTDLQRGTLKTVVELPRYRDGRTDVPVTVWKDVDLEEFTLRPRRRSSETEFELSADLFVEAERKKLRTTTIGIFRRAEAEMDTDYVEYFRGTGTLRDSMAAEEWEKLLLCCFRWQRQLSDEAGTSLPPMVTSIDFEQYVVEVRNDYGPTKGQKSDPGRPPETLHWIGIYSEAIRRLAQNPNLLRDGQVQGFARSLSEWALRLYGRNAGVPVVATIAERLRAVREGKSGP